MEKVPRLLTAGLVAANLLAAGLTLVPSVARAAEAEGLIAGTVFQHVGASLPGARITVTQILDDEARAGKVQERTTTSDRRGEFAIRVPAGSMRYNVKAEAKGFEPQEKQVQVEWDQRVSIFFRLKPVSQ